MKTQPTPDKYELEGFLQRRDWEPSVPGGSFAINGIRFHGMTCDQAEHIVRCVNAAPKAIAALEDVISIATDMTDEEIAEMPLGQIAGEITWRDIIKARAALAELKGE